MPGLSPLFPHVHCTKDGNICQVVTGESEINAASSISAFALSSLFDLRKSYFLIAGIAGISPVEGSIADVTLARYSVQVALQYEFDAREKPANFSTGYFPQGAESPNGYPQFIYGTEVFEYNCKLRDIALSLARKASLNDTATAKAYRAKYAPEARYLQGTKAPSVRACDVATSDVYYSGALLSDSFSQYTKLITNGTGVLCTTAQEDNATSEALLRAALAKLLDFGRLIVMRTASDFDRPYPGESNLQNLVYFDQGSFEPSVQNIYLAGREIVNEIVKEWKPTFEKGIVADNYIGDIFDSIPGQKYKPNFGLPSQYLENQMPLKKRGAAARMAFHRRNVTPQA